MHVVAQQTYNVCCAAGKHNLALLVACGFAGVKDLCQDVATCRSGLLKMAAYFCFCWSANIAHVCHSM